jgi:dihydroxyacid dehydratase/phosphogluconate dehydratase
LTDFGITLTKILGLLVVSKAFGAVRYLTTPYGTIHLAVSAETLQSRRQAMDAKGTNAWKPVNRDRTVSVALRAYAAMTTSAAKGAVRDVSQVERT